MKNYELIAKLMEQPAGMEVQFWSAVDEEKIEEEEEGYCMVKTKISDIDINDGIINLNS